MKWGAILAPVLELAVCVFEWRERRRQKKLQEQRQNEVDAIQSDPVGWMRDRYGVRDSAKMPDTADSATQTDVNGNSSGQRGNGDGSE